MKSDKAKLNELNETLGKVLTEIDLIIQQHREVMVYDNENKWAESASIIWESGLPRIELIRKKLRKVAEKLPARRKSGKNTV